MEFWNMFPRKRLPSLKQTWHLKIDHWKRNFLLETTIFRGKLLVLGSVNFVNLLNAHQFWGSIVRSRVLVDEFCYYLACGGKKILGLVLAITWGIHLGFISTSGDGHLEYFEPFVCMFWIYILIHRYTSSFSLAKNVSRDIPALLPCNGFRVQGTHQPPENRPKRPKTKGSIPKHPNFGGGAELLVFREGFFVAGNDREGSLVGTHAESERMQFCRALKFEVIWSSYPNSNPPKKTAF